MGEVEEWATLAAALVDEDQAQENENHEVVEESRRARMALAGNFDRNAKFRVGDKVEDDVFGESVVIGLPTQNPMTPAPGREGAAGTTWVKTISTGTRRWRGNDHLKRTATTAAGDSDGSPSKKRTSPRLEQQAFRKQRASAGVAPPTARRAVVLSGDEDDNESHGTASERDIPLLAAHERNRKVTKKSSKATGGKAVRVFRGQHSTKETKISLSQRLAEFSNSGLKISAGELWCAPCRKRLKNLKTTIQTHVTGSTHLKMYEKMVLRTSVDARLADDLGEYFTRHSDEQGVIQALLQQPSSIPSLLHRTFITHEMQEATTLL